ncbi:hypothetical protein FHG87_017175 [Trinorchestia longiramus]|nr:hypothetical protein FHG87_017175 [Trinorchestia longiramus]
MVPLSFSWPSQEFRANFITGFAVCLQQVASVFHLMCEEVFSSAKGVPDRRWRAEEPVGGGLGRVGVLVITAQTLVGLVMGGLVGWCVLWAPQSIPFREVPHYSAIPLFVSGVLGAVLLACCGKRPTRRPANALKVLMVVASSIAVVSCLCVCIFAALKLVHLAPMRCREHREVVTQLQPAQQITHPGLLGRDGIQDEANNSKLDPGMERSNLVDTYNASVVQSVDIDVSGEVAERGMVSLDSSTPESSGYDEGNRIQTSDSVFDDGADDEDDFLTYDGSGEIPIEMNPSHHPLELKSSSTDDLPPVYDRAVLIEKVYCVCESYKDHWKKSLRYPDLTCLEVNRVLPVLSVATCIVTAGGAILSGVVIYLIWASRDSYYDPIRPAEVRPIIYSSSLKRSASLQCRSNGVPYWNGASGTNGHPRYTLK